MNSKALSELKGKKIIAVNPPVEDFAFFDLWSKPLGMLYILQSLRGKNDVAFIDCIHEGAEKQKSFGREKIRFDVLEKPEVYKNIPRIYRRYGITEESFEKRLTELGRPDVILVTSIMTYWYRGVKWVIDIAKRVYPDVPIYLGGIYARLCEEHARTLGADDIVTGCEIPSAPHPAFDLYGKPPYGITMTSFGCPMNCLYCASKILWPCYKRREMKDVLAEVDYEIELGVNDIAFYDDALLIERDNFFLPFCKEIEKRYEGKINLHTPNGLHVRQINDECAHALFGTGFKTIRLSLESIDPKIADESSGKVAMAEYEGAVKRLLAAGYASRDCETYILLGLPNQSVESVKRTIDFARNCGGNPKLAEFSPIPGTAMFDEAAAVYPEIRKEPLLQNNTVYTSYVSRSMTPETLQELKNYARGIK